MAGRKPNQKQLTEQRKQAVIKAIQGLKDAGATAVGTRQIMYVLLSRYADEADFHSSHLYESLNKQITDWRTSGELDDDDFVDRKRRVIRPVTWNNLQEFASEMQDWYRRSLWQDQPRHIEFWIEKDTLRR